jgi:hypothetical protein
MKKTDKNILVDNRPTMTEFLYRMRDTMQPKEKPKKPKPRGLTCISSAA